MCYTISVHKFKIVAVTSATPTSKEDTMNTKKNRKQTIQFIIAYHNKLYKTLLNEVPSIVEDEWIPLKEDVDHYNELVRIYCKDYGLSLQEQLTL